MNERHAGGMAIGPPASQVRWLAIELHGCWHAGSGETGGVDHDDLVAKTSSGLPYLPGRTVKGLLREAVEQALSLGWYEGASSGGAGGSSVDAGTITRWFGTPLFDRAKPPEGDELLGTLERARLRTRPGQLVIGSAEIGAGEAAARAWAEAAASGGAGQWRRLLFEGFSSTRLDDDGLATAETLRTVQLAVPMVLHARIEGPPEALDVIGEALCLVRAAGSHRTRGLGRCRWRFDDTVAAGGTSGGSADGGGPMERGGAR